MAKTKGENLWWCVYDMFAIRFNSILYVNLIKICFRMWAIRSVDDVKWCGIHSKNSKHIYGFEHAIPFYFSSFFVVVIAFIFVGFYSCHSHLFSQTTRYIVLNISLWIIKEKTFWKWFHYFWTHYTQAQFDGSTL